MSTTTPAEEMDLYDYDTASRLTATDLDVSESEYLAAVKESLHEADNDAGVIRVNGRRVYAA